MVLEVVWTIALSTAFPAFLCNMHKLTLQWIAFQDDIVLFKVSTVLLKEGYLWSSCSDGQLNEGQGTMVLESGMGRTSIVQYVG